MSFGKDDDAGGNAAAVQQEYNQQAIDELKRQFGITQENIKPFLNAGASMLPSVIEGTTAEGLDSRLANIFNTDIFGSLVDERTRAVEGQLGAGGLTRSGTAINEAAKIPTEIGLMLEEILNGRATNLAGSGQNAALGLGSLGQQNSTSIASLLNSSGVAGAEGILTDANTKMQGTQNALNLVAAFSDPRLKENIEEIGEINDLKLYQWDWKEVFNDTLVSICPTIGFLSTEVKEKYPHHVGEFGGFDMINYGALVEELEAA